MSRIIAGQARGRRLATPPGQTTRPTTDRVREAFFSALATWAGTGSAGGASQLAGLGFLDLYAGSGAVGLEAASRGASPVTLVERDPRVTAVIRRNAAQAGLSVDVHTASVDTWLARPASRGYDVVWLDPPYNVQTGHLEHLIGVLLVNGWLLADGLVVVERAARDAPPQPAGATDAWQRKYGETTLHHFRFYQPPRQESS